MGYLRTRVIVLSLVCKCAGTTSHLVFKSYPNKISFSRKYPRTKKKAGKMQHARDQI